MAPAIELRGLHKGFRGPDGAWMGVLDGIDLSIERGEFVCVLGPSGCGKSTLLSIVGGFEPADSGTLSLDGAPSRGPDPKRVFVFQDYGVFPWLTVEDNVAFGLRARDADNAEARAREWIATVGLTGFEAAWPSELSGGMRQRVALARALAVEPEALLMDEPFGALDSLTRQEMRGQLSKLWRRLRPTVLFVTHDIDEALLLADRIVVFSARPGRILEVVPVPIAHPRRFGEPEYVRIKRHLYSLLGLGDEV